MNIKNIRTYAWIEFVIWLFIIAIFIFGIRYHNHKYQKQFKNYQIFINDANGLIVGSPVRFLGVQIGHVSKIQIVSSSVYIKFAITEKDFELPQGVVATVESFGLGGSKALEIYPPSDDEMSKDKIIASKNPTRLGKVISLFKNIFQEIDAIFTTIGRTSEELDLKNEIPQNSNAPAEIDQELKKINKNLDTFIQNKNKFKENLKKHK